MQFIGVTTICETKPNLFSERTACHENREDESDMGEKKPLKRTELRLVAELLKNSRRSDRDISKAIGVSQPTVTRLRTKLEKERIVREYTIIPDFERLGYQIAAFTFLKLKPGLSAERMEQERKRAKDYMKDPPPDIILFERGLSDRYNAVEVTFHRDYASFQRLKERIRKQGIFDDSGSTTFLVDLNDNVHYRYLTLATLAKDLVPS